MRIGEAKLSMDPSTMIHTIVNIRVFLPRIDYFKMKTVSVSIGDSKGQKHLENLMNEFLTCFKDADNVMFVKTYSAREKYDKNASSYYLYKTYRQNHSNCVYVARFGVAKDKITGFTKQGYSVLILGAGDICNLAYEFKE